MAKDVQHWEQLWNPRLKNNVMLIDSARDVFGLPLLPSIILLIRLTTIN